MSLLWWLGIGLYACPGFIMWCRVAAIVAWNSARRDSQRYPALQRYQKTETFEPDLEHWFLGWLLGMVCAPIWPAIVVLLVGRRWLLAPSRSVAMERQAARIAELERELDLRP